jgi:hypothetical protein
MNWVRKERTLVVPTAAAAAEQRSQPVIIIKSGNLKGAIRNRKVQKKPKKEDLSTLLLHTHTHTKEGRGFTRTQASFQTHSLTHSLQWGLRREENYH